MEAVDLATFSEPSSLEKWRRGEASDKLPHTCSSLPSHLSAPGHQVLSCHDAALPQEGWKLPSRCLA